MFSKIISKGALAFSLVGLVVATTRCDEPKPKCAAGRTPFIAVYSLTSGDATACSARDGKGEVFSISTYNAIGPDNNKPNLDIASIAIEPANLYDTVDTAKGEGAADPDATHTTYAFGYFDQAEPGDDNFCTVKSTTTALQNIPAYPADPDNGIMDPVDATSISYAWTATKFYVTPQYAGVQWEAELVKTVDGVACGYHVIGVDPDTNCGLPDANDPDKTNPDIRLCASEPNNDLIDPGTGGPFLGASLNPDFPISCDPDLLTCILTGSDSVNAHIPIFK